MKLNSTLMPMAVLSLILILPSGTAAARGNWIAVVAPGLQKEIEPLAAARRREGWEVTVLPAAADTAPAMQQIAALAAQSQPACVVLFGDFGGGAGDCKVPIGQGTRLRMKDKPTDLPWSVCAKGAAVEVGRLPARNPAEARAMVKKILAWPGAAPPEQSFPVARLLAGYHDAPPAFENIANNMTNSIAVRLVSRLPAAWQLEAAVHVDGSAWQVSGGDVGTAASHMMSSRATLLAYMGHSGPEAAFSKSAALFSSNSWRALPENTLRPGLFFTCGCYSCQIDPEHEAHGIAAVRAAGGPPAVIGARGESWAAMGYLAMSGLTSRLTESPAPVRVGEFWRAAQRGLAEGEISPAEFAMFDMADGTQGRVPLDQQRLEHLEMWMLLGDPAMPLVPPVPEIKIAEPAALVAGKPLTITGTVPETLSGTTLRVTLERHPSAIPADLPEVPAEGADRREKVRERNRQATNVVVASADVKAANGKFSAALPLPATLPPKPWTIRVSSAGAGGVLQVK